MLAFLYFVQMLINLPKMLVLSWNNMIFLPQQSPLEPPLSFRISTLPIINNPQLWATPSDFLQKINISICHHKKSVDWWRLDDRSVKENKNCSRIFELSAKKSHRVTVKIDGNEYSEVVNVPKKFWLAAIGDSFSSGQGNPNIEKTDGKPAEWLNEPCHRSSKAFPYVVSQKIPYSSLTFLSCSGATVENGILSKNGQLDSLESLISANGASPDALFLTIGGNDIGFTDVISLIQRDRNIDDRFDMRFFFVSHQIDRVAWKLKELKIQRVVVMDYYDITKNENGKVDASCGAFGQVSLSNLQLAERKILQRLNTLIRRKAKEHGWITVDTREIFRTRGICSKDSLIRSKNESLLIQGNEYGSFHPNQEAHRLISEEVLKTFRRIQVV
ncbi:unnamed protein product [Caenorhabditis brenneri]